MFKTLTLLLISYTLSANTYIEEPKLIEFKPHQWECTAEQLQTARKKFMKCKNSTMFKDCYGTMIMKHCDRLWLLR
jgi:hypothetical protein